MGPLSYQNNSGKIEARASGFPQMTKSGNKMVFAWTDDISKSVKTASLTL